IRVLCGEAESEAGEVAGSLPVQWRAGPECLQAQQVERAGHVHVVEAGFWQATVACASCSVAGGLVHGAFDASAASVVSPERDRVFCRAGGEGPRCTRPCAASRPVRRCGTRTSSAPGAWAREGNPGSAGDRGNARRWLHQDHPGLSVRITPASPALAIRGQPAGHSHTSSSAPPTVVVVVVAGAGRQRGPDGGCGCAASRARLAGAGWWAPCRVSEPRLRLKGTPASLPLPVTRRCEREP